MKTELTWSAPSNQLTPDTACCARERAQHADHLTTGTPAASLLNAGKSVSQIAFNFASSILIFDTSSSRTAICCDVGAYGPVAAESPTPASLSLRRIG